MTDSEIITATEASRQFSDLLHKVAYQGQSFTIKKGSRLMAKITPVEEGREAASEPKRAAKKPSAEKIPPSSSTPPPPYPSPSRGREAATLVAAGGGENPVATKKIIPPSQSSSALSVPEGFTEEDVSFYKNLIATMGQGGN